MNIFPLALTKDTDSPKSAELKKPEMSRASLPFAGIQVVRRKKY